MFGAYGDISTKTVGDDDIDTIHRDLQTILPDGEVVIIMEVGNEKLRYLHAHAVFITNKTIKSLVFEDAILSRINQMRIDRSIKIQY